MIFYEYFDVSTNVFDVSRMIDKCVSTKLDEIVFVWNFFFSSDETFQHVNKWSGRPSCFGKKNYRGNSGFQGE